MRRNPLIVLLQLLHRYSPSSTQIPKHNCWFSFTTLTYLPKTKRNHFTLSQCLRFPGSGNTSKHHKKKKRHNHNASCFHLVARCSIGSRTKLAESRSRQGHSGNQEFRIQNPSACLRGPLHPPCSRAILLFLLRCHHPPKVIDYRCAC